jgi:hypothetical protein
MGVPSGLLMSQPQGRPPIFPSMSLPLKIPITPGIFSASAMSIDLMAAWACGERTKTAWLWLASVMSSV